LPVEAGAQFVLVQPDYDAAFAQCFRQFPHGGFVFAVVAEENVEVVVVRLGAPKTRGGSF